jgi:hypothetical protein
MFFIWLFKCYDLIKWVPFKIFNQTLTPIIPNLKVPHKNYPYNTKKWIIYFVTLDFKKNKLKVLQQKKKDKEVVD